MTRKNIILMVCTAIFAGIYIYFFSDWFAPSDIQVLDIIRPNPAANRAPARRNAPRPSSHLVSFTLNRRLTLTEVRVIPASDVATNKHPHPIWRLISDSNSVPTKTLVYGGRIRGMRPAVKGAEADPLEPNTAYKLVLDSDAGKIEHDFSTPRGLPVAK